MFSTFWTIFKYETNSAYTKQCIYRIAVIIEHTDRKEKYIYSRYHAENFNC